MSADDWTTLSIDGLEDLDARLGELSNALAGKAIYASLNYASAPMLKEAKARAPKAEAAYRRYMSSGQGESTRNGQRRGKSKRAKRGEGNYKIYEPGTLRRSIKRGRLTKMPEFKNKGAAIGLFVSNKKGDQPPYYWYFVEYGTAKMAATPFMRPAFDNNIESFIERFNERLDLEILKHTEGAT